MKQVFQNPHPAFGILRQHFGRQDLSRKAARIGLERGELGRYARHRRDVVGGCKNALAFLGGEKFEEQLARWDAALP